MLYIIRMNPTYKLEWLRNHGEFMVSANGSTVTWMPNYSNGYYDVIDRDFSYMTDAGAIALSAETLYDDVRNTLMSVIEIQLLHG